MHMNSEKRREYIMSALKQTERPISAARLFLHKTALCA